MSFGSELASTSLDENAFFHQDIHERLDTAEDMGCFGTDEAQLDLVKSVSMDIKAVDRRTKAPRQSGNVSSRRGGGQIS